MQLGNERTFAIGAVSLALSILIGRFLHFEYAGFSVTDFVQGILIGLSLVMNITYLLRKRNETFRNKADHRGFEPSPQ